MSEINFVRNFLELDEAMLNHLQGCVIDGKSVEPTYYSPDVDLKKLEKPAIIFYRSQPFRDNSRSKSDEIRDNMVYDSDNRLIQVDVREAPEPWSMHYIVRILYEYQMDGVMLNQFLFTKFPRDGFVVVNDIAYSIGHVSSSLSGAQYKDFGKTEDGDRDFSETHMYRLDFLLDIHPRVTNKVNTKGVTINLNKK